MIDMWGGVQSKHGVLTLKDPIEHGTVTDRDDKESRMTQVALVEP